MSKFQDGWWWPDGEAHMIEWLANPKNRMVLNGRPAYQAKKQIATLEHCPTGRRRVMLDCGSHIGTWSFNFAPKFVKVEAFEPVAAHRECFALNVTAPNVTLHPYALGEREAMVHIRVNPTSTGDSWIKGKGDVPMKTIDSFGFTEVDLIKVDAEGYEEFILLGALHTIERWRPTIIVEQKRDMATKFGLKPQGAIRYLEAIGYKVVAELSGDFILVHPGQT